MNSTVSAETDPKTLKAHYLDLLRRNQIAILDVASRGLDAPVRGCPGWDVAGLTAHMGRVYTFWLKWVSERPRGFSREAMDEIASERDSRLPGYTVWDRAGFPKESRPDGTAIIDYARRAGDDLNAALAGLQPGDFVWTFIPAHQNGAFVFRRLAMETTIHRWDAEDAHGEATPIDDTLARDGIDEMLMMFREDPAYQGNQPNRQGQTILLEETSSQPNPARWLVSFDSSCMSTSEGVGPADATVRGSASDLWLYIMGRRSADEMRVDGDRGLAARWGDLAGRF